MCSSDLLEGIDDDRPPEGTVRFTHAVEVARALRITERRDLDAWRQRHVWAEAIVDERFHRWKDELHVLEVVVRPLASPVVLPWRESWGGCRSWVEIGAAEGS